MTDVVFTGGGTGGHLYPGLAIARALVRARPDVRPFFVGAQRGIERDILPTTEFPHLLLDLHPLYRPKVWQNWRTLRGAMSGWGELDRLMRERHPRLVVGTEGYAAGLTSFWGWACGVRVVMREMQRILPGWFSRPRVQV